MKKRKIFTALLCALFVLCMTTTETSATTIHIASNASLRKVAHLRRGTSTSRSINLSWEGQNNVTGYQVFRSNAYDGTYTRLKNVTTTSFCNNSGLAANTVYYYVVRAYRKNGSNVKYSAFSNIVSAATTGPTRKGTVKCRAGASVNLRLHAGTAFSVVTSLPSNTPLVVGAVTKDKNGNSWNHVTASVRGKRYCGYMRSDYIGGAAGTTPTHYQNGVITGAGVRLRAKPNINSSILATLSRGTIVHVRTSKTGSGMTWYYISFRSNGRLYKGYVCSNYVQIR